MKRFLVIDEQVIKELHDALGHEFLPAKYEAVGELVRICVALHSPDWGDNLLRAHSRADLHRHVLVVVTGDDHTLESIAIAKGHDASETAKHHRSSKVTKGDLHTRGSGKESTGHRRR